MRALKRRLIYLPSVGVRTAIYKPVEDGSDYYTLSFIPEEARVSVEPTNWKVEDVEPFSVKNFLIRIENALTGSLRQMLLYPIVRFYFMVAGILLLLYQRKYSQFKTTRILG